MKDVAPYIQHLGSYPLPLSAAYPLFSWRVLFREGKFVGIMHADDDFPVLPNDSIVIRKPEMSDIMEAVRSINHQDEDINSEVILFDLNTDNIKRFKSEDYEKILIIGVIAAAFSTHANACVAEYSDHNYYMFSVFNATLHRLHISTISPATGRSMPAIHPPSTYLSTDGTRRTLRK